jgi:predicted Na+-dependent transporter
MSGILHWAGRHGTLILPLGVVVGLAAQPLADILRPLLAPVVFLMLTFVFIRLDVLAAVAQVRRPKVVPLAIVLAVMVMPVLTAVFLMLFPQSPGLTAALILYTSAPPNFASAALAFILGLDGALAVALILGGLIVHPVLTPLFTELVTGGAVLVPGSEIALRLALLIGGAAVAAIVGRRLIGEARRRDAGLAIDGVNVVLMLVFVIGLMDGIPAQIVARPAHALGLTVLVFAIHILLNLFTALLFWRTGTRTAATIGFCSGGRNMAPAMAVLGTAVPAETWLFFAVLQFPIYLLPMVLKPLYRRLLDGGLRPSA